MQDVNKTKNKDINETSIPFYQRVKNIFKIDPVSNEFNPKLLFINQCIFAGSIAGFFIGGRIGARVGGVEHIETTKLAVYQSVTHAQREYQARVFVGFVRNGCKYGWRAGVFSGLYSLLMVVISEANQTNYEGLNYIAAGASTGIIYKSLSGWKSMVVGGIIGASLCVPVAGLVTLTRIAAPEEKKQEMTFLGIASQNKIQKYSEVPEHQARIANLKVTDDIIANLENSLSDIENASKD